MSSETTAPNGNERPSLATKEPGTADGVPHVFDDIPPGATCFGVVRGPAGYEYVNPKTGRVIDQAALKWFGVTPSDLRRMPRHDNQGRQWDGIAWLGPAGSPVTKQFEDSVGKFEGDAASKVSTALELARTASAGMDAQPSAKSLALPTANGGDDQDGTFLLTVFADVDGNSADCKTTTWPGLFNTLREPIVASKKSALPLFKLATFGDIRSSKGSLRHDANVLKITGIVADYDGEEMSVQVAVKKLEHAGVRAILYTTPTHTPERPRFRIIAALSRAMPPSAHHALIARINGVLGGVLANESFVLSQAYFYGQVEGSAYECHATFDDPMEGTCIDLLDQLDEIAIGRHKFDNAPKMLGTAPTGAWDSARAKVATLGRRLRTGDGRRDFLKSYISEKSIRGFDRDEIRALIASFAEAHFDPADPINISDIDGIIDWAVGRDGRQRAENAALAARLTIDTPPALQTPIVNSGTLTRLEPRRGSSAEPPAFTFKSARELLLSPKPVEYLIDELIERTSLVQLHGPTNIGKSFVVIDWACSVATGRAWFGRDVRLGSVFYLAGEGHAGFSRRLRAWQINTGVSLDSAPLFFSDLPASLMNSESARAVEAEIRRLTALHASPELIVIDTLARNLGSGDENSNADISAFVATIDGIRLRLGATVIVVHHTGHMDPGRARGASALPAAMDTIFAVEAAGEKRKLAAKKAKESELPNPLSIILRTTPTGWYDAKGREITSAVVQVEEFVSPPRTNRKGLTEGQRQALDALIHAVIKGPVEVERDEEIAVHAETWRREFYLLRTGTDRKKAFQRNREKLVELGILRNDENLFFIASDDDRLIAARMMASQDAMGTGDIEGTHGDICPASTPAKGDDSGHTP